MKKKILQKVLASGMALLMLLTGLEPATAEKAHAHVGIEAIYDAHACEEAECDGHAHEAEMAEEHVHLDEVACDEHCHQEEEHYDEYTGEGVSVAVLDAGITEYDAVKSVSFVEDDTVDSSHGNDMAAVLLEKAPGVDLYDVRVLDDNGEGTYSAVSKGIYWAADNEADIIVMSFVGYEASATLADALAYAEENGVLVVTAAGNDGDVEVTYPAAYPSVIAVGALTEDGVENTNFNCGEIVDIYVNVCGGTSAAAQYVAAMAAQLMQENENLTMAEVREFLAPGRDTAFENVSETEEAVVYAMACSHVMGSSSWKVTRAATCTSTGKKEGRCTKCGVVVSTVTIAALGHSYGSWTTTKSATCTAAGSKKRTCTRQYCYVYETQSIAAKGHSYSAATCTAAKKCSRCGVTSGSALGHSYSAATCTAAKKCSRCGGTSGSALGHSYSAATCTAAKKCSRCGVTSGSALGHSYAAATCTSAKKCTRCGGTSGSALGHSYAAATCTSAKKCSRCGVTSGSSLGHSYAAATCTSAKKCSRCGGTSGSALGHSYSAATCTAAKKCTRCGATSGVALGHSYAAATCTSPKTCTRCGNVSGYSFGHSYAAATCTSPQKCTRCGGTTGTALGHNYAAATCTVAKKCTRCGVTSGTALGHNYAAATCTSAQKCTRCSGTTGTALGHSYSAATCTTAKTCTRCGGTSGSALGHNYAAATCTMPKKCTSCGVTSGTALDHSWSTWTETKAATCTTTGTKKRTCTRTNCTAYETAVINELGHISNGVMNKVNPTCAKDGYTAYICSRTNCGAEFHKTVLEKTGNHDWRLYSVIKASTCTEKGTSIYRCSACGTTESRTTSELGHASNGVMTETKKATCTEDGRKEMLCTRCNSGLGEPTILKAKGHDWRLYSVIKESTCTEKGTSLYKCSVCGGTESRTTEELGHASNGVMTVTKKATCTEDGRKEMLCTRCNTGLGNPSIIYAPGHDWRLYSVLKASTCTEKGTSVYKCSACETTESRTTEALGHKYVEKKTEPTCTVAGSIVLQCSCGDIKSQTVIAAKGHTSSGKTTTIAPTCKVEGYTAELCAVETCKAEFNKKIIAKTTNHSWKQSGEQKTPTCEETGSILYECDMCGATKTEVLEKIGHEESTTWTIETEATCIKAGTRVKKCKNCPAIMKTETYTASSNHDKSDKWVVAKPATCAATGVKEKRCKVCGKALEATVIMRDSGAHKYGQEVVTKKPTTTTNGEAEKTCELCGNKNVTTLEKITFNIADEKHDAFDFMRDGSINPGFPWTIVADGSLMLIVTASEKWTLSAVDENGYVANYVNISTDSSAAGQGKLTGEAGVTCVYIRLDTLTQESKGTRSGKLVFVCEGETREYPIAQDCEHVFGDFVVTQEPTPERPGIQSAICEKCGGKSEYEVDVSFHVKDDYFRRFEFAWDGNLFITMPHYVTSIADSNNGAYTGALRLVVTADCDWTLELDNPEYQWIEGKNKISGGKGTRTVLIKPPSILETNNPDEEKQANLIFRYAGQTKKYEVVQWNGRYVNDMPWYEYEQIAKLGPFQEIFDIVKGGEAFSGKTEPAETLENYLLGRELTNGIKVYYYDENTVLEEGENKTDYGKYFAINTYVVQEGNLVQDDVYAHKIVVELIVFSISLSGGEKSCELNFNIFQNSGMLIQHDQSSSKLPMFKFGSENGALISRSTNLSNEDPDYEFVNQVIEILGLPFIGASSMLNKLNIKHSGVADVVLLVTGEIVGAVMDDSGEVVEVDAFAFRPEDGTVFRNNDDRMAISIHFDPGAEVYADVLFEIVSKGSKTKKVFSRTYQQN